jgi:hypothetical protein
MVAAGMILFAALLIFVGLTVRHQTLAAREELEPAPVG